MLCCSDDFLCFCGLGTVAVDEELVKRQAKAVRKMKMVQGMCNAMVRQGHLPLARVLLAAFTQEEDIK